MNAAGLLRSYGYTALFSVAIGVFLWTLDRSSELLSLVAVSFVSACPSLRRPCC